MDPYKVLGVQPGASSDDIKNAYNNILANYNVNMNNLSINNSTEKALTDANIAYDLLINGNLYKEIRNLIEHNNFVLAESKLNLIDHRNSAEWNYLQGFISLKKGWFDTAVNHIKAATDLDPENPEYKDSLITLQSRANEIMNVYKQNNPKTNPPGGNNNMGGCPGGNTGGGGNGGMC
ncbi:J domain-containing protein [Clostridium septicum]|uniref:ABC transporter substrate-binding protein n=1 Tax=Clostridium septicum TaxID=1504 RepID=A0A9N7PMQ7_CLOSE|nr:J domain-containing protein [Clostridium septicum]AYE35462.1 ABC transporter substrate-binding protein [Clostridium septicum]MDU1314117.1 J domain-containing protein [Clostridium septicum]QAS60850.1 J domain-containing protein [Clostridium septicum]UEC19882.1 J domain-containing protein [Clostridium septicum]USS02058.1 J domain-containing protein [Clostridium septicum]